MQSDTYKIFHTALASWFQIVMLVISNILIIPLILHKWDPELLGLWLILISLTQLTSIINLSHQTYLYNRCFTLNIKNKKLINKELLSAIPISLLISLSVIVVLIIFYKFDILIDLLNINKEYSEIFNISIIYLSVFYFFSYSYGNFLPGPFSAFGHYHVYAWIKVFRTFINSFVPAIAIFLGASFIEAVYFLILSEIISFIIHIFFSLKYFVKFSFKFLKPNINLGLNQFKLSFFILINSIIDFIKNIGLRLILTTVFSPLSVSYFVTLRIITNFIKFSIDSLRDPLFPKLMTSFENNQKKNILLLIETYWIINIVIVSPILIISQILAPFFFEYWTLNKIKFQPYLFNFLIMSLLFYSINLPFDMILKGFNKNKKILTINLFSVLIFLISFLILINFYSLVSVGIAIFISEISAMFFYFINIKKFLKDKKIKINERFFYLTLFIIIHTCLLISLATIIDVSIVFYLYTLITFVIFIFNIKRLSSKKTSNLLKMKFKLIK